MSLAERLEQVISVVAPTWAAERQAARLAMESAERLSAYRGATHTRLDRPVPETKGTSPDWTLERGYERRALVDRARQLEQSSVLAEGMLSRTQESVVGNGFRLQAKTKDAGWNEKAEALWKEWCDADADVRGLCSFGELLGLVFRSYLRDGDVGTVLLATGQLRVIESDEIASPQGYQTPNLVDGIQLDDAGKPTVFHVVQNPRAPVGVDRRALPAHIQVPAENVLFLARRRRLGQTRGISAFSGVTWILDQIDGNIEAVTVASRMAACFGIVIKRRARANGLQTETGADGIARRKLRVEPGAFFEVEPDEDVKQVQAAHPHSNFSEFLRVLGRIASVSFGLPIEVLFMDFEKTNYSNARAALLQSWNVWRVHQRMLMRYCSRVYTWKLLNWIETGQLPARDDALEHGWIAPGWQWIDPKAEIEAAMAAVDAGLEARSNIIMRLGYDPDELWSQMKKDQDTLDTNDIETSRSTLTREPLPEQPPGGAPGGGGSEKNDGGPALAERLMGTAVDLAKGRAESSEFARERSDQRLAEVALELAKRDTVVAAPKVDVKVEPAAVSVPVTVQPATLQAEAPVVHVHNNVPTPSVQVDVAAPEVTVNNHHTVEVPPPPLRRVEHERDEHGRIVSSTETPAPEKPPE